MSLLYSPAATATVAANTNSISIAGMDLSAVLQGMVINIGARDRVTGDGYIIASVAPNGTSGGTLTTVGPISGAFNSAGFVIDTRDFNGSAPNYLIATYTQVLNALLRLTSPLTNLFTGSRQLALDKDNAGAISRLLYAVSGRTWGALEQRTLAYTPNGGVPTSTETLALRAYPDGTTPVEAVMIDLATGGVDVRKASVTMAALASVDLGSAPFGKVALSGNATIVSFGAGRHLERLVHMVDGGSTLVHNATSLILPGGANIITAAGDCFHATSDGSGTWRVRDYARASGKPLTGPATAEITDASSIGRSVLTGTAAQGAAALGLGSGNSPTFSGTVLAANGDVVLVLEDTGAASTAYRRKTFYSSRNVGGGSDTLLRAVRPSDGATLDYLFSASAPGTVLTTGSTALAPTFRGVTLDSPSGSVRGAEFKNGGSTRFYLYCNPDAESGGNAGSNFALARYTDAGAIIDTPFFVSRSTGKTTLNSLSVLGATTLGGPVQLASYTVATLPAGTVGAQVYASNARKVGEASGSGTGVIAYYSNSNWRRLSDDSPVAA